jgi:hypothetical protein
MDVAGHYAGIGTRQLTPLQRALCWHVGRWLAKQKWCLHTGAATGADQAFAEGAASVPEQGFIILHRPWKSFEATWVADFRQRVAHFADHVIDRKDAEARDFVKICHPAWQVLGGNFPLMARNVRILKPDLRICRFTVAARSEFGEAAGRGGTEFGIKLAQYLKVPIVELPREGEEDTSWQTVKQQLKDAMASPPRCDLPNWILDK